MFIISVKSFSKYSESHMMIPVMQILNMRVHVFAKLIQSCPTLCNSTNHRPPDSSFHGILQARILQWVAIPSSRGSSQLRD